MPCQRRLELPGVPMRVVERGVGRCVISWMTKIDIAIAGCCAARVTALECGQAW